VTALTARILGALSREFQLGNPQFGCISTQNSDDLIPQLGGARYTDPTENTRMTNRRRVSRFPLVLISLALSTAVLASAATAMRAETSASSSVKTAVPGLPANSVLPTISGSPVQGQTLSISTGQWSGSVTSYSYAWQRCVAGSCTAIAAATTATRLLAAADVGATIRAVVTATNKRGSTTATTAAVGPVAPPPATPPPTVAAPSATSLPTISGSLVQGSVSAAGGTRAPVFRSLLVAPTDYGVLCLVFVLYGATDVFVAVYSLLFAATAAFLAAACVSWFREMSALGRPDTSTG